MDFDFTTETITPDSTNILTIGGTGALELPVGTTLQQPITAIAGAIRWNTTIPRVEYYSGSVWKSFGTVTSVDLISGAGISVSGGPVTSSGSITVTNTGVISLAGTADQISVSTSTGSITASIPSTFIAPGSLQYTTNVGITYEEITAAGSTQGTATPITKTYTEIIAGAVLSGIILPVPSFIGEIHYIANTSGVEIYVWPNIGVSIADGTIDVNTYINPGDVQGYIWGSDTWDVFNTGIAAGNTGITLSSTPGNTVITNTGVLSFSASTTGLTPATATTGNIVLGGTLNISNGGTGASSATLAFNALSPLTTSGDTLYYNGTNNVRLPISSNGNILSIASGLPSWVTQASMSVGSSTTSTTATNLAGGAAGYVPYQTASGSTSFVTAGTSSQVLVSGTTPSFVSVPTALGYTPVNKAGDTMTGALTLSADPVLSLQAATKQYVDANASGLTVQPAVVVAQTVDLTTLGNGSSGPITTVGTFIPGSLYTNGTYTNVPLLTNNVGAGAEATVVVSGNVVTSFSITSPGNDYVIGDELYIGTAAGASGIGFMSLVASVSANWGNVTYTAGSADLNGGTGIGATLAPSTNGILVLDGYKFLVNDRILIRAETNQIQNGIYVLTTQGSASTTWLLTRAADYDDSVINQVVPGNYIFVMQGKTNKNTGWTETGIGTSSVVGAKTGAIEIGTDNIVYAQFSGNTVYTAGVGLDLIGTEFINTGVISLTTNTGLSTNVSAAGNVTVTNTGVTSIIAGPGISVSSATGNVTVTQVDVIGNTIDVSTTYIIVPGVFTIFADATSAGFVVSLPAVPNAGEIHNIKKIDQTRNIVTISGNGNSIDKYTTIEMNVPFTSMEVQWSATTGSWFII